MPDRFDAKIYEYRPRSGPKCSSQPNWLQQLKASGTTISLDDVWRQAGRHFADSLEPQVVGFNGTSRQLATETAWRLVSMLRPQVNAQNLLELTKPDDQDIQRLGMEILGVGGGLELLRRVDAIDGRTIRKISSRFDFEAYTRGGAHRLRIEVKGTLSSPSSRQKHRASIQNKINHSPSKVRKGRSYDQRLGVIFLGWTPGAHGGVDFEIADPNGDPGGDRSDALAAIAAFYARTFQLVGVQGAERFWAFSQAPTMPSAERRVLFQTSRRVAVSAFSKVTVSMRFTDELTVEFGGAFWRTSAVPFKRDEIEGTGLLLDYCFIGVDKRVVSAAGGDDPFELLELTWDERHGTFAVELEAAPLVPQGSRERRFRGVYHLSGDGLLYVWSNVIPQDGLVDVRQR